MNHKPSLAPALVAAALLAACSQDAPPPPPAAETPSAEQAPATPASSQDPGAYEAFTPSGPALDHRAFSGRFSGTLPCAACPGTDTVLVLKDDYRFELEESFQGSDAAAATIVGTWAAEDDGHRIRLDPDDKAIEDRLFLAVANDEIRALDKDGKPIDSVANLSLRRGAASQ